MDRILSSAVASSLLRGATALAATLICVAITGCSSPPAPGHWEERLSLLAELRDADVGLYHDLSALAQDELESDRVWNLEATYHAAYFARANSEYHDVEEFLPERTVTAVRDSLSTIRGMNSTADLMMAAIILDIAGESDQELEADAIEAARAWLQRTIPREDVFQAKLLFDLYVELTSSDSITLDFDLFNIATDDDQKAAWTVLSLVSYAENRAEVEEKFGEQRKEALELLEDPGSGLVKDVYLAHQVLGADADLNQLSRGLKRWLSSIQGCEYAPYYYQVAPASGICTLQATYQLMRLGLEDRGWD